MGASRKGIEDMQNFGGFATNPWKTFALPMDLQSDGTNKIESRGD